LNLQEEWVYPLAGLAVPPEGGAGLEQYAAARLFADRARRARPDFDLGAEGPAVALVCRLTEGLPLALELAAAWAGVLSCDQIADEIARGLAVLVARRRNLPERHRSMGAVFDSSWALLDEAERAVLMRLACFRGGFSAEAAARVAGASLPVLAGLADKSLLRVERGGRYQIHELLRQLAEERLDAEPEAAAATRRAHSAYFLDFLAERDDAVSFGRDPAPIAEIVAELENVRLAWRHAVEAGDVAGIGRGITSLANLYLYRGPYAEGVAACELAVARLRAEPPSALRDRVLAVALDEQAWLYINLRQPAVGRRLLEETHQIYARLGVPFPGAGRVGDPRAGLAYLALLEGDYVEAARLAEAHLRLCEEGGHARQRPFAWRLVCRIAHAQGRYALARQAGERAYAAVQAAQDRWFESFVLLDLGKVLLAQGDPQGARRYFRASYASWGDFGDPEGRASSLLCEGQAALSEGDLREARELFAGSLALYRTRGHRSGLAESVHGLGRVAAALGDEDGAAR
ncbi:MAG TPA: hypothetical protein PKD53_34530, partial [Chloroflexaceae bacterium]|nr:hypothetical protein [Chloroflexaceae bacterium]